MSNTTHTSENVYIGLGSNVGNRIDYLKKAKQMLEEHGLQIRKESSVYESLAWGYTDQDKFLNQVIELVTDKRPEELVTILKSIEQKLGRKERGRWQEREIDLDILLYDQEIVHTPQLEVPHRFLKERKFVLMPLAEIAGDHVDPESGTTISQLLEETSDDAEVYRYNTGDGR